MLNNDAEKPKLKISGEENKAATKFAIDYDVILGEMCHLRYTREGWKLNITIRQEKSEINSSIIFNKPF